MSGPFVGRSVGRFHARDPLEGLKLRVFGQRAANEDPELVARAYELDLPKRHHRLQDLNRAIDFAAQERGVLFCEHLELAAQGAPLAVPHLQEDHHEEQGDSEARQDRQAAPRHTHACSLLHSTERYTRGHGTIECRR